MAAEAPAVEPSRTVYWAEVYQVDVTRLRALGCRCPLHCEVKDDRVFAAPQNDLVAAACLVDHQGS